MKFELHVEIEISCGVLHPDEITKFINIEPTGIYVDEKHGENTWKIISELPKDREFEDHVLCMLDVIEPALENFKTITSKYYTKLFCAIYRNEYFPSIYLNNEMLKKLADLNIHLDIDIYSLS